MGEILTRQRRKSRWLIWHFRVRGRVCARRVFIASKRKLREEEKWEYWENCFRRCPWCPSGVCWSSSPARFRGNRIIWVSHLFIVTLPFVFTRRTTSFPLRFRPLVYSLIFIKIYNLLENRKSSLLIFERNWINKICLFVITLWKSCSFNFSLNYASPQEGYISSVANSRYWFMDFTQHSFNARYIWLGKCKFRSWFIVSPHLPDLSRAVEKWKNILFIKMMLLFFTPIPH